MFLHITQIHQNAGSIERNHAYAVQDLPGIVVMANCQRRKLLVRCISNTRIKLT